MFRGRVAVHARLDATCVGNQLGHFRTGQQAAVSRLGALRKLDFDHLDLWIGCIFLKHDRVEGVIRMTATEIAGTNVPN